MVDRRGAIAYPQARIRRAPRYGLSAREMAWMLLLGVMLFMQVWAFSEAAAVSKSIAELRTSIATREGVAQTLEVQKSLATGINRISNAANQLGMVRVSLQDALMITLPPEP